MTKFLRIDSRSPFFKRFVTLWLIIGLFTFLPVILLSGRGLGLRNIPRSLFSLVRSVISSSNVKSYSTGNYTNIVFLHHSTGEKLIEEGHVREIFLQAGYNFWDHGYNYQGLRGPDGIFTGYSYNVPGDNTDPDGLARIFNQRVFSLPLNTFSGLLQHEVIITKSCFAPTSKITSDEQLEQYKRYYLEIRDSMSHHADKLFLVLTQPPLNPAETDPEEAIRARELANWLKSDKYLNGYPNLFTFDLFDNLAVGDPASPEYSMLRPEYRNGIDSHPNQVANEQIGPLLVDFVVNTIQGFRSAHWE
jgi:hypothetical protein